MTKKWKTLLLKSGLPLEYEVSECLVSKGCTVWEETSFLRHGSTQHEAKEFSYDIHANCWISGYSVDFIVECKYKSGETKWFFTPYEYGYQYDLEINDFLHPIDHFVEHACHFSSFPYVKGYDPLGPYCQKGIELFEQQYLEKNIRKAISQVSYAFIDRVTDCWMNQLMVSTFDKAVFCNIPLIVTNAEIYQIKPKTTIIDIQRAESIEEISEKTDFLLYYNHIGDELQKYNLMKISRFLNSMPEELVQNKLRTFTKDIGHFVHVFSSQYSPKLILIMQHTEDHKNYDKLFRYINEVLDPGDATLARIQNVKATMNNNINELESKARKKKQ